MPLQSDIADKLFVGIRLEGNIWVGALSMGSGLRHSERLAGFLRQHFGIGEPPPDSRLHVWKELQSRGQTLESLYSELRQLSVGEHDWVCGEFEAIVRTTISETVNRSASGVCEFHRAFIRALEPGDYIVDFNWDTLASDALYYSSRLWFPLTGFGQRVGVMSNYPADAVAGESYIKLLHVHGCVGLYVLIDHSGAERRNVIYVAPETYDPASSMLQTLRLPEHDLPDKSGGALREPTAEEQIRFRYGWIRTPSGEWLKPLFVPPSSDKPQYEHWYHRATVRTLHTLLPGTKRFVLAGYSIPPADLPYLASMFVPQVIDRDALITVINRDNENQEFRGRVDLMFPTSVARDYSVGDFATFCEQFMDDEERRTVSNETSQEGVPSNATSGTKPEVS
jgi:hypothetical protein